MIEIFPTGYESHTYSRRVVNLAMVIHAMLFVSEGQTLAELVKIQMLEITSVVRYRHFS